MDEEYYSIDGWTRHGTPSVIVLNVVYQDGVSGRSLNGMLNRSAVNLVSLLWLRISIATNI